MRGAFELHYKTLSEGLGALNWLMIEPQPREIIEAQIGAADYSANKWGEILIYLNPSYSFACSLQTPRLCQPHPLFRIVFSRVLIHPMITQSFPVDF